MIYTNDQTLFQPAYGIAKEAFSSGENAAFNFAVNEEVSPTLQATGPGAVAKPDIKAFGVCSKQSHAMLSDNPHSGFYEAETSRTLDRGGGNPACNQGGICVCSVVWCEAVGNIVSSGLSCGLLKLVSHIDIVRESAVLAEY